MLDLRSDDVPFAGVAEDALDNGIVPFRAARDENHPFRPATQQRRHRAPGLIHEPARSPSVRMERRGIAVRLFQGPGDGAADFVRHGRGGVVIEINVSDPENHG